MSEQGAYGDRLGRSFRQAHPPTLVVRTPRRAQLAATELRCDRTGFGKTSPIPPEDGFLVGLQLRDCFDHLLWVDGRPVPVDPFPAGTTSLYDLSRNPIANMESPFHCLQFYLPRAALDELADEAGSRPIGGLIFRHGVAYDDPIIRHLGACLLAALDRPQEISMLFVEQIALAFRTHVAQRYGGMTRAAAAVRGGLTTAQERRAKQVMIARLDEDIALEEIARECGLSRSHFLRAFKRTAGLPPHRWLMAQRVERAKELLLGTTTSLSAIAAACGFADQSHFTRVFSRIVGTTPGAWQRDRKG